MTSSAASSESHWRIKGREEIRFGRIGARRAQELPEYAHSDRSAVRLGNMDSGTLKVYRALGENARCREDYRYSCQDYCFHKFTCSAQNRKSQFENVVRRLFACARRLVLRKRNFANSLGKLATLTGIEPDLS